MATPESFNPTPERKSGSNEALEAARAEQLKRIEKLNENAVEKSPEKGESAARHEALDAARSIEHEIAPPSERKSSPAERRSGPNKAERDASFKATMSEVQSQMSAPSRAFSKVIHTKGVEKASEVVGSTVARPNALLTGALFAFVLTLAVYLIAKNIGYPLSGFESIGAFILGWILGLVYDFVKVMITGRK
ncbi:hypothetical protein PV379_02770 [Streptomyces caniscabiei]|uniref:hypothetical protein n=1 Tax=Streptomyces caniscabiei TaxID=2746961 RepID=UPI0029B5B7B0|nr:hypothetical protein [Streptomyces caniscabiei]MDX2776273.1 hypothetical protein [Streptomyces caniscabiei]